MPSNKEQKTKSVGKKMSLHRNYTSEQLDNTRQKCHMTPQQSQLLRDQINHFGIQYEHFVDIQKAFLKADTDKDELVTIEEFVKSVYGLG